MLHISRCVLTSWTQWDHPHGCISFLSKVIPKKVIVRDRDLRWPRMTFTEARGKNFHLGRHLYLITTWFRLVFIDLTRTQRFWIFSHWLIMGRSRKWPDPRSSISKFRDIRFVGTGALRQSWKFHTDHSITVAVGESQTFLEVGLLDLTWWPDLIWPEAEIFRKCAERMSDKVCQKRRRFAPPFFRYPRKTWRGGV